MWEDDGFAVVGLSVGDALGIVDGEDDDDDSHGNYDCTDLDRPENDDRGNRSIDDVMPSTNSSFSININILIYLDNKISNDKEFPQKPKCPCYQSKQILDLLVESFPNHHQLTPKVKY